MTTRPRVLHIMGSLAAVGHVAERLGELYASLVEDTRART